MNRFIIMIGLPASGKSYHAERLSKQENAIIMSSDKLREELYGDENTQENNSELFNELHKRIKENLKQGFNVIYDATNISHKRRKTFLNELRKIPCIKECYLVATPYEKCLYQNNIRERKVPEHVIKKMYKNIYIPQYYEGWDKIHIINNYNPDDFNVHILFNSENGLNKINQDNPHHTLTIGKHCLQCAYNVELSKDDDILIIAGLFHDIGKKFTKEFKNGKGEDPDIAHYFNHHLVSAYDSLFYLKYDNDTKLKITNYIQWHMQPFFLETEKSKNKFINLVGQEFYDDLMILHRADIEAK